MLVDSDNFLWIALRDRIVRIDPRNNKMKIITDARLNDAYINALADDGKRIWMSLTSGLFFIEKATLKLRQINSGGTYYSSLYYDNRIHRMIAGGINEYVEFDPESILAEDNQNNLFITSLWVNNKLVQDNPSDGYTG